MGFLKGPDFFYALRFLRLLTTKWENTNAFKMGIVDKNGKKIKKPETSDEKSAYNTFHKLVYNIKRLINKLPLGKSTIASYAAALFLVKEHTGISDKKLLKVIKEATGCDLTDYSPELNEWYLTDNGDIEKGKYALARDIALPKTGELLAKKNTWVEIVEQAPVGSILGHSVFKATHIKTQQQIYITQEDISK
jgi:hypothetical protein|tara:strand:+ start:651 stop:1229 length:579 start_codon:yes stop_codon:yes gene_type:complete